MGVDNIDLEAATAKGILVMNTAEASTLSTAEHALALMFSLRKIPQANDGLRSGNDGKKRSISGDAIGRQDAGRRGPGPDRPDRREPALAMEMNVVGLRSVLQRRRPRWTAK